MRSLRQFLAESRKEGIDCGAELEAFIKLECGGCASLAYIMEKKRGLKQFKGVYRAKGKGPDGVRYTLEDLLEEKRVLACSSNTRGLWDKKKGRRRYRASGHDEEGCDECRRYL